MKKTILFLLLIFPLFGYGQIVCENPVAAVPTKWVTLYALPSTPTPLYKTFTTGYYQGTFVEYRSLVTNHPAVSQDYGFWYVHSHTLKCEYADSK
jgi:hypothetical protein